MPVRTFGKNRTVRFLTGLVVLPVAFFAIGNVLAPESATGGTAESQSALRSVPGMAKDYKGVLRDDKIALYEAYGAEIEVSACMTSRGHSYVPAVLYPAEAVVAVAGDLAIGEESEDGFTVQAEIRSSGATLQRSGATQNLAYRDSLDRASLNQYYLDLYGESLESVEYATISGATVLGEQDFGQGGCRGIANANRSSVFDLRRKLEPSAQRERERRHADSEWSCSASSLAWVQDMADLEELDTAEDADYSEVDIRQCEDEFAAQTATISVAADQAILDQFRTEIFVHQNKYRSLIGRLERDSDFRAFLEAELPSAIERASKSIQEAPFNCSVTDGVLSWTDHHQSKYWIYRSTDSDTFSWVGRTLGGTTFTDDNSTPDATYQVHYEGIPRTLCN